MTDSNGENIKIGDWVWVEDYLGNRAVHIVYVTRTSKYVTFFDHTLQKNLQRESSRLTKLPTNKKKREEFIFLKTLES